MGAIENAGIKVGYLITAFSKPETQLNPYTLNTCGDVVIRREIKLPLKERKPTVIVAKERIAEDIKGYFESDWELRSKSKETAISDEANAIKSIVKTVNFSEGQKNYASSYCVLEAVANMDSDYVVIYEGTTLLQEKMSSAIESALEVLVKPENNNIDGIVLTSPRESAEKPLHYLVLHDNEGKEVTKINGDDRNHVVGLRKDGVSSEKVPAVLIYRRSALLKLKDEYSQHPKTYDKEEQDNPKLGMIEKLLAKIFYREDHYKPGDILHISTPFNHHCLDTNDLDAYATFLRKWNLK